MDHDTNTETAALLAEVDALIAESDAIDRRTDALLRSGSPAVRLADLALQMELGRQELDQIERDQLAIEAALSALDAP